MAPASAPPATAPTFPAKRRHEPGRLSWIRGVQHVPCSSYRARTDGHVEPGDATRNVTARLNPFPRGLPSLRCWTNGASIAPHAPAVLLSSNTGSSFPKKSRHSVFVAAKRSAELELQRDGLEARERWEVYIKANKTRFE